MSPASNLAGLKLAEFVGYREGGGGGGANLAQHDRTAELLTQNVSPFLSTLHHTSVWELFQIHYVAML